MDNSAESAFAPGRRFCFDPRSPKLADFPKLLVSLYDVGYVRIMQVLKSSRFGFDVRGKPTGHKSFTK